MKKKIILSSIIFIFMFMLCKIVLASYDAISTYTIKTTYTGGIQEVNGTDGTSGEIVGSLPQEIKYSTNINGMEHTQEAVTIDNTLYTGKEFAKGKTYLIRGLHISAGSDQFAADNWLSIEPYGQGYDTNKANFVIKNQKFIDEGSVNYIECDWYITPKVTGNITVKAVLTGKTLGSKEVKIALELKGVKNSANAIFEEKKAEILSRANHLYHFSFTPTTNWNQINAKVELRMKGINEQGLQKLDSNVEECNYGATAFYSIKRLKNFKGNENGINKLKEFMEENVKGNNTIPLYNAQNINNGSEDWVELQADSGLYARAFYVRQDIQRGDKAGTAQKRSYIFYYLKDHGEIYYEVSSPIDISTNQGSNEAINQVGQAAETARGMAEINLSFNDEGEERPNYTDFMDVIDNRDNYRPSDIDADSAGKIETMTSRVLTVISNIGIALAVIILAIIGVKYMLGSVEERAEYKKDLIPYVVGAVILFSITTIMKILLAIGDKIANI